MVALADGPLRYSELRQAIEGVSEKMLTQTLRSLERDGLVERKAQPRTPPNVSYALTDLGRTLQTPLNAVRDWAERYINDLEKARLRYDLKAAQNDKSA